MFCNTSHQSQIITENVHITELPTSFQPPAGDKLKNYMTLG